MDKIIPSLLLYKFNIHQFDILHLGICYSMVMCEGTHVFDETRRSVHHVSNGSHTVAWITLYVSMYVMEGTS